MRSADSQRLLHLAIEKIGKVEMEEDQDTVGLADSSDGAADCIFSLWILKLPKNATKTIYRTKCKLYTHNTPF